MSKEVKWYILSNSKKQTEKDLSFFEELSLSFTYSESQRVLEEFNTFEEAKIAFTFYKSLLSK